MVKYYLVPEDLAEKAKIGVKSAELCIDDNGDDAIMVSGNIVKISPPYMASAIVNALRRSVPATSEQG